MSALIALIVSIKLASSNVPIESHLVKIGWGLICGSVFLVISNSLVYKDCGYDIYVLAFSVATIPVTFIYAFSSLISWHLKLNDKRIGMTKSIVNNNFETKFNGIFHFTIIFFLFPLIAMEVHNDQKFECEFEHAITKKCGKSGNRS